MQVIIVETADDVAGVAAGMLGDAIRSAAERGAPAVLGVATGSSPEGVYRRLADEVGDGSLDVAGVRAFALDEYVGLPLDHPQSYHSVVRRAVTEPLGLDPENVHVPDGSAENLREACERYEALIAEAGGIDVQLLGIGSNGHIGFNEPISSFSSRTRVKTLAPETRADNARFFPSFDEVPVHCVTQGLETILEARSLVLIAHGSSKASAVAAMIEGPLSSRCPASALQLHRDATVVLDRAAAGELQFANYYKYVMRHQPPAHAR